MAKNYRIIVIGGGTAGLRTALACASNGVKTLLVEESKTLGGTCLNTGCIPTKAMLHSSSLYRNMKQMKKLGIDFSGLKVNIKNLNKRTHHFIEDGQEHIRKSVKNYKNLTLMSGKASFIDKNSIQVGKHQFSADNLIIATGAKNIIPAIEGLDSIDYLDNESVLNLEKIPKSVIMIGGGYIAMEFATFFNDLGCEVTVLEKMPSILGMLDTDVVDLLSEIYNRRGVKIFTNTEIVEARKNGIKTSVVVKYDGKRRKVIAENVLLAVGRTPNTAGLNLTKAGIKTGIRNEIKVNDMLQTSNPNIFAIGDVNGRAMFAHTAKRESKIVLENIFGNKKEKINLDIIPWAVFTEPTIAGVGLSEKSAKEKGIKYGILKAQFSRAGRAAILDETEGFVKVLYNKDTGKILGSTIIGPDADNLIHEIVALMNSESTIDVLKKTIHIHPTLAEVMENLREI